MVIGVCDDYELTRKAEIVYLEQLSEEIGVDFQYQAFGSGEEVLAYSGDIDILLLDIELPGINGIETMRLLEDYDNVKAILFVTGYDSYMGDAYSTKTYGFIRKPIKYEHISTEIRRILNRWERKKRKIELSTVDGTITQPLDDIIYIYAEKNYVRLVAKDRVCMLYGNLKNWQEYLEKYNIIRVHKSYLVNLERRLTYSEALKKIGNDTLVMYGVQGVDGGHAILLCGVFKIYSNYGFIYMDPNVNGGYVLNYNEPTVANTTTGNFYYYNGVNSLFTWISCTFCDLEKHYTIK